tara:strand:- start:1989 stop:2285 length:297 start_codon:yes stop_codon:yes gene_type:complete
MRFILDVDIERCAICGSLGDLEEDWGFRNTYQGTCSKFCGNKMVGYNMSPNRAVHKWNNQQILIRRIQNNEEIEIRLKNRQPTTYMKRLFKMVNKSKD